MVGDEDADTWVARQQREMLEHPAWPGGGAVLWRTSGHLWDKRWDGWVTSIVMRVGGPPPAPETWWAEFLLNVPPPEGPVEVRRLAESLMGILGWESPLHVGGELWALRADAPIRPFWWELEWRPGVARPPLTPHGVADVTPDQARRLLVTGNDVLRGVQEGVVAVDAFLHKVEGDMRGLYATQREDQRGPYRELGAGAVADVYGLTRPHFYKRLKNYGLRWPQLKAWNPDVGVSLYEFVNRSPQGAATTRHNATVKRRRLGPA